MSAANSSGLSESGISTRRVSLTYDNLASPKTDNSKSSRTLARQSRRRVRALPRPGLRIAVKRDVDSVDQHRVYPGHHDADYLAAAIPGGERVVSVEEVFELKFPHPECLKTLCSPRRHELAGTDPSPTCSLFCTFAAKGPGRDQLRVVAQEVSEYAPAQAMSGHQRRVRTRLTVGSARSHRRWLAARRPSGCHAVPRPG